MASSGDFHERSFDEGTLTKLEIFELFAREWLPVFLASASPIRRELHIFDFFAGPGADSIGQLGSPLRLIRQLRAVPSFPGGGRVKVAAHFYDADVGKVQRLRARVKQQVPLDDVDVEIECLEFQAALNRNATILQNREAAKLLLIDQYGVEHVTDSVFRDLVRTPTCDFLFFLSSWTLHRFRDHPAIRQKITRPDDHYHVHRAALDYYRTLLPPETRYFLAPFSIKKESGIYGIIFGSAHPRGMDKFLQVAWKKDQISGEADFDINRDNIVANQPKLDFAPPTKLWAFERDLEELIRKKALKTEYDVIQVCFRHGVKRQHAEPVIRRLKAEGVLKINWRVPDIGKIDAPRPLVIT
jgi:three-Cys-motif partner protein